MTVEVHNVEWSLFFGCMLIAFSPLATLFFLIVAKRAQLVIFSITSAFFWLISILVSATFWYILPFLKNSIEATIPVTVIIQELFRYLLFCLYERSEKLIKTVTTPQAQLPLNDLTSSIAAGVGLSLMNSLMMYGSVLASSIANRGASYAESCSSLPLVFVSALISLALSLTNVALTIIAFDGYRKKSILHIGSVFVLHLFSSLATLLNLKDDGCVISIPIIYIFTLVSISMAFFTSHCSLILQCNIHRN